MSWNYSRAHSRIARFAAEAPQVRVENYDTGFASRIKAMRSEFGRDAPAGNPLYNLPAGVAVVADTVQIYVNLVNYDEQRLDEGRETEASHRRALAFLHLHYAALDRVVEDAGAQRVDFHGARLHAVIAEPAGPDFAAERVARGLRLALDMMALSQRANRTLYDGGLEAKFRVGIDAGACVAIDSGRHDEREPLFIGSAANHAAKLADGSEPGVFVSPGIRAIFGLAGAHVALEQVPAATQNELAQILKADRRLGSTFEELETDAVRRVATWQADIREHRAKTAGPSDFLFHEHRLPLRSIDYQVLMPSNSVRMALVSIFADIDGYTDYIDSAVVSHSVADAVRNLHVIRSELNAVIQDDFDGRKVRFIGDCIHGLIADGEGTNVNERDSVDSAAQCAGALRSSFHLCRDLLSGVGQLGLAIGFELGPTPISRIGIRGERSVRVASSKATIGSEACQSVCDGDETRIGDAAYAQASPTVRAFFPSQVATELVYDDIAFQDPGSRAAAAAPEPVPAERHHAVP